MSFLSEVIILPFHDQANFSLCESSLLRKKLSFQYYHELCSYRFTSCYNYILFIYNFSLKQ